MQLHGCNTLITGASRGLGASLARALAAQGARLALVARDPAPLDALAASLRDAGAVAWSVPGDVGAKDDALRLAGAAAALVGPIDLLVHNASDLGPTPLRDLRDLDCEDLERVLAVNVVGPFRLTRALVGSMSLRRTGTVLFVSSDAAVEAYPRWGAYGASKAAADQLARVWRAELAADGVTVASADPGEMDTAMHAAAVPDADRAALAHPDDVAAALVRALREEVFATTPRLDVTAYRRAR
ncbi:MAG: SDR family oxidoreductase [Polyangiales bacterium]